MTNELSLCELESEMAVVLPEREALSGVRFHISQHTSAININSTNSTTVSNNTFNVWNIQFRDLILVSGSGMGG